MRIVVGALVLVCCALGCGDPFTVGTGGTGGATSSSGNSGSSGTGGATTSVGGASGSMSSSGSGGMITSSTGGAGGMSSSTGGTMSTGGASSSTGGTSSSTGGGGAGGTSSATGGGGTGASTSSTGGTSSSTGGGGTGGTSSSSGGGGTGGTSSSTGGGGTGGDAGGPSCPTNGNVLFTGNSCYEYQVYRGGMFLPPPEASEPDAACESMDCSVSTIPGDIVLVWNKTNTLKFHGNVNNVVCKCSAFAQPPQKAGIIVELNAAPAATTISDTGSGQDHKYVVAACAGAIVCMVNE